jgi:hypothetical protein
VPRRKVDPSSVASTRFDVDGIYGCRARSRGLSSVRIAPKDASVVLTFTRMIAVMTMNVGYFLSVLSGVFVGSVVFGRFTTNSGAH